MAMSQNRPDIVEFFIDHGADPNCMDITGKMPLSVAFQTKNYDLFKTLLQRGANPNISDLMGKPFIFTVLQNTDLEDSAKVDILRMLLSRGCDANSVDIWGEPIVSCLPIFRSRAHLRVNICITNR
jgi:ankyrin repeat protein